MQAAGHPERIAAALLKARKADQLNATRAAEAATALSDVGAFVSDCKEYFAVGAPMMWDCLQTVRGTLLRLLLQ